MSHELTELDVREISLVGSPANRQKFLLYKSAKGESSMALTLEQEQARESFEEALNTEVEDEERILDEALVTGQIQKSEVSDGAMNLLRGGVRLLSKAADELPLEALQAIAGSLGLVVKAEPADKGKGEPVPKPEPKESAAALRKVSAPATELLDIAKAAGPVAGRQLLDALEKDPDIATVLTPVVKSLVAEREQDREKIRKFEESEEQRVCGTIAKELGLPGDAATQVKFLKSLTPAQRESLQGLLKPAREVLAKADKLLLQEVGSGAGGSVGDSAYDMALDRAKKMIEKSAEPLDQATALEQVFKADPELYERYSHESYMKKEA